jgi:hypothetical protein
MRMIVLMLMAMVLVGCDQTKGQFQIVAAPASPNHEDKVWILDTRTGRVSLCYETAARIKCLEPSSKFSE